MDIEKEASESHGKAMDLAEQAHVLTIRSFHLESAAANLLKNKYKLELTRSVLYRSAATLALSLGYISQVKYLVDEGLKGNPPKDIKKELNELLKQIKMKD